MVYFEQFSCPLDDQSPPPYVAVDGEEFGTVLIRTIVAGRQATLPNGRNCETIALVSAGHFWRCKSCTHSPCAAMAKGVRNCLGLDFNLRTLVLAAGAPRKSGYYLKTARYRRLTEQLSKRTFGCNGSHDARCH